jgi:hypothetical protein
VTEQPVYVRRGAVAELSCHTQVEQQATTGKTRQNAQDKPVSEARLLCTAPKGADREAAVCCKYSSTEREGRTSVNSSPSASDTYIVTAGRAEGQPGSFEAPSWLMFVKQTAWCKHQH